MNEGELVKCLFCGEGEHIHYFAELTFYDKYKNEWNFNSYECESCDKITIGLIADKITVLMNNLKRKDKDMCVSVIKNLIKKGNK